MKNKLLVYNGLPVNMLKTLLNKSAHSSIFATPD